MGALLDLDDVVFDNPKAKYELAQLRAENSELKKYFFNRCALCQKNITHVQNSHSKRKKMKKQVEIIPCRYGKHTGMWALIIRGRSWIVSGSVGLAIYTVLKLTGYLP